MTKKFTQISDYTFSKLCINLEKLLVPPFQRAYAWKAKQINDLWDSIVAADDNSEYFIGNIVLLDRTEESDYRYTIIDGQQRLFTTSIFLLIIRNEFELIFEKDKKNRDRVKHSIDNINRMLFHREDEHPFKETPRLLPGKENLINTYTKLLDKTIDINDKNEIEQLDDNQLKYAKNFRTINRLVQKFSKPDKISRLELLIKKISSLLFIVIVCKSDNDAYSIFEGLNATGIGLTVADLVKNSVLQSAKSLTAKVQVEQIWEQIESEFERSKKISLFPKFLRHQWISHLGYITSNKLFDKIKSEKLRKIQTTSELVLYTQSLLEDCKAYIGFRSIENNDYLYSKLYKKIKDKNKTANTIINIRNFLLLDIEQVYEVILSYYNKFLTTKYYTDKQLNNDLKNLWTFSFRAKIIAINPSEYERLFADYCEYIYKFHKKQMDQMSQKFHRDLKMLVGNDKVFIENFPTEIYYSNSNDLLKHILCELIYHEDKTIKITKPTIEHILPQEPSKWKFKKEEILEFVNSIGNLTLLDDNDNKTLSNGTMDEKMKKVFNKSHFKFNKNLTNYKKDFIQDALKAIEKRSNDLAVMANGIWQMK